MGTRRFFRLLFRSTLPRLPVPTSCTSRRGLSRYLRVEIAASLYHAGYSCYSAGGSTLSILSMVTAAVRKCGREIIAVRNAHLSFVNACVHCDAEIHWLVPEYDRETGLCLPVTADEVAGCMDSYPGAQIVYLTSPDYYGVQADVRAIAQVVHRRGGILLCDNAHGAHLIAFDGAHPMEAGADLCCDSPHKTLPVLTGGSILHCSKTMAQQLPKLELKHLMTLYGSTSPSYLIMASLEQAVLWMQREGTGQFLRLAEKMRMLSDPTAAGWGRAAGKGDRLHQTDAGWVPVRVYVGRAVGDVAPIPDRTGIFGWWKGRADVFPRRPMNRHLIGWYGLGKNSKNEPRSSTPRLRWHRSGYCRCGWQHLHLPSRSMSGMQSGKSPLKTGLPARLESRW